MAVSISTCLIVRDEAQLLANCLRSVRSISDEIIVVDTGSRDATIDIARGFDARIIQRRWDTFARARNAYLQAARGQWILIIDADETIACADLPKIAGLVGRRSVVGYRLPVRNYTDDFDLMWNWHANDGSYPFEESLSACAGWMKTVALRLFRNLPGLAYDAASPSAHPTVAASLKRHRGGIESTDAVSIHHFQYLKGGRRFVARKQYDRLAGEMNHVKRFPDDPHHFLNAAKTLFAQKQDREAEKYLQRAIKLNASCHDAYQLLGMIALESGRLSSALRHLKHAIDIRPDSADAWALLGMTLVEDGRPRAAMRTLTTAIQLRPDHLLAHNSLGVLYEDLGMYDAAIDQYEIATGLHPRFRPALVNLARARRAAARGLQPVEQRRGA